MAYDSTASFGENLWTSDINQVAKFLADQTADTGSTDAGALGVIGQVLQARTNMETMKHTRRLVWATWALAGVTIALAVATAFAG